MTLSDLISEVGLELNRSDIDTRIKRWIQQSIDFLFNAVVTQAGELSVSLTATASTETLALPTNFGEALTLRYTPGDGSGYQLQRISPGEFFRQNPDQVSTGFPAQFCIYGGEIHLAVLPASTYSYTLTYRQASSNIYVHSINLTDDDNAAASGVQIYLDEDAVETGVGKFYFVSPTDTDGVIQLASVDGHVHNVTIYDNDNAATLGVAVYFDEDGSTTSERLLFVSPTGLDCVVQTENTHLHSHYIQVKDEDNAASTGVGIYCDEDAVSKTGRLLFVSPTDTDGTSEIILAADGTVPPFLERYHEAIFLGTVGRGYRYEQRFAEAKEVLGNADAVLAGIVGSEGRRGTVVFEARPFSGGGRDAWDAWRFPEIDD